jgi:hypothetical protein
MAINLSPSNYQTAKMAAKLRDQEAARQRAFEAAEARKRFERGLGELGLRTGLGLASEFASGYMPWKVDKRKREAEMHGVDVDGKKLGQKQTQFELDEAGLKSRAETEFGRLGAIGGAAPWESPQYKRPVSLTPEDRSKIKEAQSGAGPGQFYMEPSKVDEDAFLQSKPLTPAEARARTAYTKRHQDLTKGAVDIARVVRQGSGRLPGSRKDKKLDLQAATESPYDYRGYLAERRGRSITSRARLAGAKDFPEMKTLDGKHQGDFNRLRVWAESSEENLEAAKLLGYRKGMKYEQWKGTTQTQTQAERREAIDRNKREARLELANRKLAATKENLAARLASRQLSDEQRRELQVQLKGVDDAFRMLQRSDKLDDRAFDEAIKLAELKLKQAGTQTQVQTETEYLTDPTTGKRTGTKITETVRKTPVTRGGMRKQLRAVLVGLGYQGNFTRADVEEWKKGNGGANGRLLDAQMAQFEESK